MERLRLVVPDSERLWSSLQSDSQAGQMEACGGPPRQGSGTQDQLWGHTPRQRVTEEGAGVASRGASLGPESLDREQVRIPEGNEEDRGSPVPRSW